METATKHPHVVRNDAILSGEPIISGTRTSVRAVVEVWRLGKSPEEICQAIPAVSLAQVFDALSYFEDNRVEIQELISRNAVGDSETHPLLRKV